MYAKSTHISTDVIEFGDESVLDNIHGNLWGDHHDYVRKQHPQVVLKTNTSKAN